jgi:3',5'-cyclic AMP phosphodiesterase CpdA
MPSFVISFQRAYGYPGAHGTGSGSDLHFGANDDSIVRLQSLVRDLKVRHEGLGIERLDYLLISGDLTNRGAHEEFERVQDFLSDLVAERERRLGWMGGLARR